MEPKTGFFDSCWLCVVLVVEIHTDSRNLHVSFQIPIVTCASTIRDSMQWTNGNIHWWIGYRDNWIPVSKKLDNRDKFTTCWLLKRYNCEPGLRNNPMSSQCQINDHKHVPQKEHRLFRKRDMNFSDYGYSNFSIIFTLFDVSLKDIVIDPTTAFTVATWGTYSWRVQSHQRQRFASKKCDSFRQA